MKPVSRKELLQRLLRLGFSGPYSGGQHQFVVRQNLKLRIPNPHGSGEISGTLLKEILKQGGISNSQWEKTK